VGSHYDSRPIADRDSDPSKKNTPIPGANDGASSTAILLELARVLPSNLDNQVWLVFFDAEDVGNRSGSGWANGSEYFVSTLTDKPDQVIVLDMVGDRDLDIMKERNSTPWLSELVWAAAGEAPQVLAATPYEIGRGIYERGVLPDGTRSALPTRGAQCWKGPRRPASPAIGAAVSEPSRAR